MEINSTNLESFNNMIKKEPMVVFYYASWCGHCISFKPTWDSFVTICKKKHPKVKLAKVESEVIPSLNYNANIQGYPTVKFYNKDVNAENNEFGGERSTKNLLQFVEENSKKHGVDIIKSKKRSKKRSMKRSKKRSKKSSNNIYIVFGASWCGYCKRTKELLDKKGLKYKYYDIENNKDSKEFKKYEKLVPKHLRNMVPVIFKNKKYIEGYSGLLKELK